MADNKQTVRRLDMDTRGRRQHAMVTKILSSQTTAKHYDSEGNRKGTPPPTNLLHATSQRTAQIKEDIESIEQLLPDIKLSKQILISGILSPKDMGTAELIFSSNSIFKNQELGSKLIKIISDYFTDDYKINESLSEILNDALFDKGAHIRMILPESSLDDLINQNGRLSLESVKNVTGATNDLTVKPLGLLSDIKPGNKDDTSGTMSLESMFDTNQRGSNNSYSAIGNYIQVIDNPDAAKMPRLFGRIRKDQMSNQYNRWKRFSLEKRKEEKEKEKVNSTSIDWGKNDREIEQKIESSRRHDAEPYVEVKTHKETGREMYGHPMVMTLSSEAVIPAHTPSNPSRHIAYFILLDQFGNPINTGNVTDHYQDLQMQINNKQDSVSSVLQELRGNDTGQSSQTATETIQQATNAFADIIERNLLKRLRGGMGNDNVELTRPSDVYEIMLTRLLAKKNTQLLYVPAEMMSYIAFYYNKNGVGKSLLEESRVLGSMRVLLMFSNTMAAIRNSTARTDLEIEFDPNDTDPMSTAAQVKDAFMRSRSEGFPLAEGDPSAMINYLQQAGVSVVYSGHEGLPQMRVQAVDQQSSRAVVDRDLEEQLRNQHIMSLGLSPETVDTSNAVDFATTVVNSSLMLSKRIAIYQQEFEPQIAKFIKVFTENSEPLVSKLEKEIEASGESEDKSEPEETIQKFIESIEVSLPRPDSLALDSKMESFMNYSQALEDAVGAYINDEFAIHDQEGDLADYLMQMRAAVKAHYQRRWLRDNNMFTELEEMILKDDDGDPIMDFSKQHSDHMDDIFKAMEGYILNARKARKKRDEKLAESEPEAETSDGGFGSDTGGSDDSGGFGGGFMADDTAEDDEGGFGSDAMSAGVEDEPAEEPEEPEADEVEGEEESEAESGDDVEEVEDTDAESEEESEEEDDEDKDEKDEINFD